MHKKGASLTLTSLLTLRHNPPVRDKLALRKGSHAAIEVRVTNLRISFCKPISARPSIAAALMPFGALRAADGFFRLSAARQRKSIMAVRLPTLEQIGDLGSAFGIVLSPDEASAFQQAFKGPVASYGRLDELVPPSLAPVPPRSPGDRK